MTKTFNINLAGQVFTINEDAYEQLLTYFTSLEKFYSTEAGKDEILNDIKSRFAEVFLLKGKSYIITIEETTLAIKNMGNPEEFEIDEQSEKQEKQYTNSTTVNGNKKLYRDPDNSLVAGICSGLTAYFGWNDPIWLRIAFILMVFIGIGSPFIIYLILWIVMPEAKTAAQKLEMSGQQINLNNIEKKVHDELEKASDNIQKKGIGFLQQIVEIIGKLVKFFFKAIVAIGLAVLVLVGGSLGLVFLLALIGLTIIALFGIPYINKYYFVHTTDAWAMGIGGLLLCIIPIILITVTIVHVLSKKLKPLKKRVIFPLIGLFILGIALTNLSIYHAKELVAVKKKINQTYPLNYGYSSDTLMLSMNPTLKDEDYDNYSISINSKEELMNYLSNNKDHFFPVSIEILSGISDSFVVVKEFSANGKDEREALKNATLFSHQLNQNNNQLIIDPFIKLNNNSTKFRNQKLKIKVYVPEGKVIQWDKRTEKYIDEDKLFINWDSKKDNSLNTKNADEIDELLEQKLEQPHYIFKMHQGELTAID